MKEIAVHIDARTSEAHFSGLKFPGAAYLVSVDEKRGIAAFRMSPGKYWSSMGQPWAYSPAEFRLFECSHVSRNSEGVITGMMVDGIGFMHLPIRDTKARKRA